MATTYLTRTPSSGAATQKVTFSFWVKKTNATGTPNLFRMYTNATQYVRIRFESSNKMSFIIINSDSYVVQLISTKVFRDPSAWYHIVCNMDTTQATASDRAKIYVNGERITAYDTAIYPPTQNANIIVTPSGTANHIGTQLGNSPSYFEGCMSHVHFTDGYVYQASEFGSVDSTSGIWKINTSPSVTYGTNGFFILKDGNTITDSSPNSNNFSLGGGTLTKTEDCPSNVFATLNSLATSSYGTLIQGNNTVKGNTSTNSAETFSTLSTNNDGKYYYEIKCTGVNGVDNPNFGFIQTARGFRLQNGEPGLGGATNGSLDIRVQPNGKTFDNGAASGSAVISTYTDGDILGFAIDSDNGAFYVSKNGVWQTSGNPESGASRTGAIKTWSPTDSKVTEGQSVCIGVYNTSIADANFGNGYFGTTAVTSAGTNASSNGIFEYDVPTGYTALSTKGLNL